MKVTIEVHGKEISFHRNWFTGKFTYTEDGTTHVLDPVLKISTHLTASLSQTYRIPIGTHTLTVLKQRPLLMAGLRPHSYKFYTGDQLIKEIVSF